VGAPEEEEQRYLCYSAFFSDLEANTRSLADIFTGDKLWLWIDGEEDKPVKMMGITGKPCPAKLSTL